MADTTMRLSEENVVAEVPPRLFGSFVEHLGRSVYGGIFDPESQYSDEEGFREDVLELVRELGVTCVRYPGGNFVSGYRWEDGTGPREQRPARRDLAWHTYEPNLVGIDDFHRWARKADLEVMLAVNMGTRGLQEALDELEYVNGAAGTALADRRIANGIPDPMNIKMWCIGNEMDGPWQIGHMSAEEYASAVEKTAHAMKLADSGLELVACGSSSAQMPTFGTWEQTVLTRAYPYLDFVSCHDYYFRHRGETVQDYLLSTENMSHFIAKVSEVAESARESSGEDRRIALSFDEWGVWDSTAWNEQEEQWKQENAALHDEQWPFKPHLLEQTYTAADAVVEGALMMTLLSHCDVVRSASRAQLVNVIAPIMVDEEGRAWRQTTFYPFAYAAKYARGTVLSVPVDSPKLRDSQGNEADAITSVVTKDDENRRVCILLTNRDAASEHSVELDLSAVPVKAVAQAVVLHGETPESVNSAENDHAVAPVRLPVRVEGENASFALPPVSWACVVFEY